MTLIKFNGSNNPRLPYMQASLGELLNDFMNNDLVSRDVFKSVPAVNISENPESYSLELAAPGMIKEDFKIEVEKGVLTISSEKKEEKSEENNKFTRKEFSYASFKRTFKMPEHVNTEAISASYENGVLKLQMPKKDEAKQKPVREIIVS